MGGIVRDRVRGKRGILNQFRFILYIAFGMSHCHFFAYKECDIMTYFLLYIIII